ncbi:hypothetical protein CEY00_Acc28226 [Actinidia chinensis var. chinensis]|uniref:RWP-RK domain-containing protein n=1 Tax=Actinidia chinensis var. chinensis TaxID=1590841 RepID=A0A2R6PMP9_ACTCC|nr:hypothetical protein CEY00_Acc28226 [Actinidia chinensis var. chinensis]
MADPSDIVPYFDPFDDIPIAGNILTVDENLDVGLELPLKEPNSFTDSIPQSGDGIAEANDPISDPVFWGMFDSAPSDSQAGPSEFRSGTSHRQEFPQPGNLECGTPVQVPNWPVPPVPYSCSCCQVLREITHTNGIHVTKLEIHGRLGMICHAILENRYGGDWNTQNQYQMFDFCKKSIEAVKEFLVQYCEERTQAGFTMLQDPLLIFYEALCVGLNGDKDLDIDDFLQSSPPDLGVEYRENHPGPVNQPVGENDEMRLPKSSLAAQRERTGKLRLKDLIGYFHLPINTAAKKMNVCPTVIKKVCRKHGLQRWPHRKIKSIERKISTVRENLNAGDVHEQARAQADLERLQQELVSYFSAYSD